MNDHYLENARRSKAAMGKVLGRYAAQGSEVINETNIGLIDCFFSRAVAGPHAVLEGRKQQHRAAVRDRARRSDRGGPVLRRRLPRLRPGPPGRLHAAQPGYGDAFYWIAARQVLLFGGLLDLDYGIYWPEGLPWLHGHARGDLHALRRRLLDPVTRPPTTTPPRGPTSAKSPRRARRTATRGSATAAWRARPA